MDHKDQPAAGRRPYEKPTLIRIDLTAEEVMGGCKSAAGDPRGAFGGGCSPPAPSPCSTFLTSS